MNNIESINNSIQTLMSTKNCLIDENNFLEQTQKPHNRNIQMEIYRNNLKILDIEQNLSTLYNQLNTARNSQ